MVPVWFFKYGRPQEALTRRFYRDSKTSLSDQQDPTLSRSPMSYAKALEVSGRETISAYMLGHPSQNVALQGSSVHN
jgi:hypothetical protein